VSNRGKVRIWDIAEPGSLVASLFTADGLPVAEGADIKPVALRASYVPKPPRGEFPEGALLTSDRLRRRRVAI
jgi:hypothetical protein